MSNIYLSKVFILFIIKCSYIVIIILYNKHIVTYKCSVYKDHNKYKRKGIESFLVAIWLQHQGDTIVVVTIILTLKHEYMLRSNFNYYNAIIMLL